MVISYRIPQEEKILELDGRDCLISKLRQLRRFPGFRTKLTDKFRDEAKQVDFARPEIISYWWQVKGLMFVNGYRRVDWSMAEVLIY